MIVQCQINQWIYDYLDQHILVLYNTIKLARGVNLGYSEGEVKSSSGFLKQLFAWFLNHQNLKLRAHLMDF